MNTTDRYSERISYDKNSNVSDVSRYGMNNLRGYGVIDSLEITRSGNQLVAIEDHAEKNLTYTGASDFVDGTDFSEEYAYDGNGRLTMDTNRGIGSITYDLCNNPQAIAFSGTNGIQYVYAPDGTKLRTVHKVSVIGGSVTRDTTDYYGNLVLRNGHLCIYRFDGGYVSFSNDTIDGWHYYIQDYMGNNRMVVNSDGTIEQVTHYYPYGGVIGDISTLLSDVTKGNNENVQKYKLFHYIPREQARSEGPRSHQKEIDNLLARRRAFRRGVELDRTFGLDNYYVLARQYFTMMSLPL